MSFAMSAQRSSIRPPSSLAEFSLNDENPTVGQLLNLQRLIDRECMHRSTHNGSPDSNVACGTIIRITVYLSSQLLQWGGADSDVFRETQLRALVAAFALLHHSGVEKLTTEPYDQLRRNIAGRYNDIVNVSRSTLESSMRKANALYLIRLADQYFSLIERAEPLSDTLTLPILGLVLVGASVASGQYTGLRSVFHIANDVISLIPGRKGQNLNLPAVQEIARRAITLLNRIDVANEDSNELEAVEAATDDIKLIQRLLESYIQEIPLRKGDPWNWPWAKLRLGPPSLNKWYFFYGLLDCAAQLARGLGPDWISARLLGMFARIMEESEFEEFRWKILEICLACFPTHTEPRLWQESLQRTLGPNPPLDFSEPEVGAMTAILKEDRNSAGADEVELGSATDEPAFQRLHQSRNTTADALRDSKEDLSDMISTPSVQRTRSSITSVTPSETQLYPQRDGSISTGGTGHMTSLIDAQATCSVMNEARSRQFMAGELAHWQQAGEPQVHRFLSSRKNRFDYAGLSDDCKMSFFTNDTKLYVRPVIVGNCDQPRDEWLLKLDFHRKNPVTNVSLSNTVLAVSTQKNLELYRVQSPSLKPKPAVDFAHGEWDPSGLATYECLSRLLVAVGYRQETKTSRIGRVIVRRLKSTYDGLKEEEAAKIYELPLGDFPKSLNIDSDGKRLVCVLEETESDGVTSAVIYNAPSKHSYVLCSTSASTERFRSRGEWSFSSPIPRGNAQVPSSSVHDFVALTRHRQLVAGAVSSKVNIYALLEKTGKVLILRLTAHEEGGIHDRDGAPMVLKASLCSLKSSRASTACLRFDPSGKRLYAVDPEGKLLCVTFRPENGVD
ncbi:MAG: hypothetical protein Q9225_005160 [Loekoesia sp. 1 TL-2023]